MIFVLSMMILASSSAFFSPSIMSVPTAREMMTMFDQDLPTRFVIRSRGRHNPYSIATNTNRILKDVFETWESTGSSGASKLALDVRESKTHYDLFMDAPGIERNATKLEVKDHILTISTERKSIECSEDEQFNRVERFSGVSSRSLKLGEDIDEDNIEASYVDGVLHIHLPKKEEQDPSKKIKNIQIKSSVV